MTQPTIVINGVTLTAEQVEMLRAAVHYYGIELRLNGLGNTYGGRQLRRCEDKLEEILQLMNNNLY